MKYILAMLMLSGCNLSGEQHPENKQQGFCIHSGSGVHGWGPNCKSIELKTYGVDGVDCKYGPYNIPRIYSATNVTECEL